MNRVHFVVLTLGLTGQPGEGHRTGIVDIRDALTVAPVIGVEIAEQSLPVRTEDGHDPVEIGQAVTKLDHRDEIELVEDLGDEMNRRLRARSPAELANVPRRDVDTLVELRRRDLGSVDPLTQDLEAGGSIPVDRSVIHGILVSRVEGTVSSTRLCAAGSRMAAGNRMNEEPDGPGPPVAPS